MTPQLTYLIAHERHIELAYRAEQPRLAGQARAAGLARPPRWRVGRLLATRRRRAARVTPAATLASLGPPQECLRCDT